MDKIPENQIIKRRYLYIMLTIAGALVIALLFFFIIFKSDSIESGISVISKILRPFIMGGVIAYILSPTCNWLEKHLPDKIARPVSVSASMLFAVFVVAVLLTMIIPSLVTSITKIVEIAPDKYDSIALWVEDKLENHKVLLYYAGQIYDSISDGLSDWLKNRVIPWLSSLAGGVGSGVLSVFTVLKDILVSICVAIYFLAGRKNFARQAKMMLYSITKPKAANIIYDEVRFADRMFTGFLTGKILDSAIIGVICYIFCVIVKMPNSLLVSVIVGLTNIIPVFGPFIGAIPSALLILIDSPKKMIVFVVFIIVLQQIDGNVIGPKILGNNTGLSSFWVLFSIVFFGGIMGFTGMIIGVPFFAVIYDIITRLVRNGLKRHGCSPEDMKNPGVPEIKD